MTGWKFHECQKVNPGNGGKGKGKRRYNWKISFWVFHSSPKLILFWGNVRKIFDYHVIQNPSFSSTLNLHTNFSRVPVILHLTAAPSPPFQDARGDGNGPQSAPPYPPCSRISPSPQAFPWTKEIKTSRTLISGLSSSLLSCRQKEPSPGRLPQIKASCSPLAASSIRITTTKPAETIIYSFWCGFWSYPTSSTMPPPHPPPLLPPSILFLAQPLQLPGSFYSKGNRVMPASLWKRRLEKSTFSSSFTENWVLFAEKKVWIYFRCFTLFKLPLCWSLGWLWGSGRAVDLGMERCRFNFQPCLYIMVTSSRYRSLGACMDACSIWIREGLNVEHSICYCMGILNINVTFMFLLLTIFKQNYLFMPEVIKLKSCDLAVLVKL